MKISQTCPAFINFDEINDAEHDFLKKKLFYKDLSIQYQYTKAKNNRFKWIQDPQGWNKYCLALKEQMMQSLLLESKGNFYTYAGLKDNLIEAIKYQGFQVQFENKVKYPEFELMPYQMYYKPMTLHPYQTEAVEIMLKNPHASIELPTGSGKQFIIETLTKRCGLSTLIVVPFRSIAHQFLTSCEEAFGKKYVGLYGDGKKDYKKQIVIGISDSISRLKEGTEAYDLISKKDVLIFDESHLVGAPTVASIATGVAKNIPYRWSVSATQLRVDGKDMLLEGIVGKIIYQKTFRQLVDLGFLADLHFHIYNVESDSSYQSNNPSAMMQKHHLFNENMIKIAASIANVKYEQKESTLILVDEIKQAEILKNYLTVPFEFAQSESDVVTQVNNFNEKKNLILIGTKVITTGTNTKPTQNIILLMSGKSVIKYKQALGRGTRTYAGKKHCNVVDFNVVNIQICNNHFNERLRLYEELSPYVKVHNSC